MTNHNFDEGGMPLPSQDDSDSAHINGAISPLDDSYDQRLTPPELVAVQAIHDLSGKIDALFREKLERDDFSGDDDIPGITAPVKGPDGRMWLCLTGATLTTGEKGLSFYKSTSDTTESGRIIEDHERTEVYPNGHSWRSYEQHVYDTEGNLIPTQDQLDMKEKHLTTGKTVLELLVEQFQDPDYISPGMANGRLSELDLQYLATDMQWIIDQNKN